MNVRTARRLAAAALVALLPACASLTMPGNGPVAEHRSQWQAQHLADYSYQFQRTCFCAEAATQPVTIEVRSGHVSRVLSRTTGQPLPNADVQPGTWPTVDDLFQQIDDLQAAGTTPLVVRWDGARGYPTYIEAGTLANDAGAVTRTGSLQPL
jgi:hypothetical protein